MSASPQPPQTTTPVKNSAGLIALILGIVAVVLALVPFASYVAWLVGIAAIVVGVLAIIRPGLPKRAGIVGIVLGAVAVILSVVMSIVYTCCSWSLRRPAPPAGTPRRARAHPSAATAQRTRSSTRSRATTGRPPSRTTPSAAGQSGQSTLQNQALPWSKTVTVRGDLTTRSSVLTVVGQNAGSGAISCSITLDGKVVSEQSGEGENSTAQCIYRPEN